MKTPDWLQNLMADPRATDICINGPDSVFVDRGDGLIEEPVLTDWTETQLKAWTIEQLSQAGRSWDARHPFIDTHLENTHRLHVVFPPISQNGLLLSLRKLPQSLQSTLRWQDSPALTLLKRAVVSGESILVSGATGSGKTTLVSDLLRSAPQHERMVALEDTPELHPAHPHFISLLSRPPNADGFGEVTLRCLLKQTLRMRPDRLILGECRGSEVLDLLQALNTGHRGALGTIHANSARDALRRAELLCLIHAGGSIPYGVIRDLLAGGIQWIAHVERTPSGRIIRELVQVVGREGDTILLRPMI